MNKTDRMKGLRKKAEDKVQMMLDKNLAQHLLDVKGKELLHELQVQMVELTFQNEELSEAHNTIEDERNRYKTLYDSAPACYLTIDHSGIILEANLTAAHLLNVGREKLIGHHFQNFLESKSADSLHLFLKDYSPSANTKILSLRLQPQGDSPSIPANVHARLDRSSKQRKYLLVFVDPIWFRPVSEQD